MLTMPSAIRNAWVNEETQRLKEGRRRYIHFDFRLSSLDKNILDSVWNPSLVARHSFFPLICREKRYRKYKRDPVTKKKIIKIKVRPISYAAHFDSIILSWYGHVLSYYYEKKIKSLGIHESITGYRKLNRSNLDFAYDIIKYITTKDTCAVICTDLEKFFETLDHKILKEKWAEVLEIKPLPEDHYRVYRNVTRFSFVYYERLCAALGLNASKLSTIQRFTDPRQFREMRSREEGIVQENTRLHGNKGIPQGTTISAILSNIYMLDVDSELSKKIQTLGGIYRRYSDDIIVVCPADKILEAEQLIKSSIEKSILKINESKTERLIFAKDTSGQGRFSDYIGKKPSHLTYLGVHFDGSRILLRHAGVANYQRKMIRTIKKMSGKSIRSSRTIPRKQILSRFYYSRSPNFLSYAKRAAVTLNSPAIAKQLAPYRVIKQIKKAIKKHFLSRAA